MANQFRIGQLVRLRHDRFSGSRADGEYKILPRFTYLTFLSIWYREFGEVTGRTTASCTFGKVTFIPSEKIKVLTRETR